MPTTQTQLDLIPHEENGAIIFQRGHDGFINATAMCQAAKKRIGHYLENRSTIDFLDELSTVIGIPTTVLVQSVQGGRADLQGTWVHPQVAIHLAQWLSAKFAVKVSTWVHDWLSGNGAATRPAALPTHLARYLANDSSVPAGYFSVLQETGLNLFGPLHNVGFEIPDGWVPDISVGKLFCAWLRSEKQVDTDALPTYRHNYNDKRIRPIVDAKLYPDELLADFRRWFRTIWLPENGMKYFRSKDPQSLAFLGRIPALGGSGTPPITLK